MRLITACILLVFSGCCSNEIHESAAVLKRDFGVYRKAVVPNPELSESSSEKVAVLGELIESHIDKLEELSDQ